jgi:hypothetical protein
MPVCGSALIRETVDGENRLRGQPWYELSPIRQPSGLLPRSRFIVSNQLTPGKRRFGELRIIVSENIDFAGTTHVITNGQCRTR